MIRLEHWRHRAGGQVVSLWGDQWLLEVTISRRRRNRFGVREPLTAHLYRYDDDQLRPNPAWRPWTCRGCGGINETGVYCGGCGTLISVEDAADRNCPIRAALREASS